MSWLDPLEEAGSTTDYRYKVQWSLVPLIQRVPAGHLDRFGGLQSEKHFAEGPVLPHHWIGTRVEYTVRVVRITEDGDSGPSNEAKATPATSLDIFRMTVKGLVVRYGEEAPWIQQTWQYLEDNNVLVTVGEVGSRQ